MTITTIIPPEVKDDEFYYALQSLAKKTNLRTFLEIGSSSGGGTTEALVTGIRTREDKKLVKLFCMELSRPRFFNLANAYANDSFLIPYNLSSVALNKFPSVDEVTHFYQTVKTNLNQYPLTDVLEWLASDIQYITDNCLDIDGIEFIKEANKIDYFDMVLIDGSAFTGEKELCMTLGAKIIALDDVNDIKCYNGYTMLLNNSSYKLITRNLTLRNGFAIFERRF
jgi:hypothetical protein